MRITHVHVYTRYSLTEKALDDLLKLIRALLPQPNLCVQTSYSLKKVMAALTPDIHINRHVYCSYCNMPISDPISSCHGKQFLSYFVSLDLDAQLKARFKG